MTDEIRVLIGGCIASWLLGLGVGFLLKSVLNIIDAVFNPKDD